ncbi:hypothetical protein ACP4OV_024740 [Aristida adscensionis]
MDPFSYLDIQYAAAVGDDDYLTSLAGLILQPPPPPATAAVEAQGSAFVAYRLQREATTTLPESSSSPSRRRQCGSGGGGGGANVHGRMFGYLRRIGCDNAGAVPAAADAHTARAASRPPPGGAPQAPRSSAFRHIMRERLRRERLSQGFADLHALLPPGASRGGKNDIVAAAAVYIRELVAARARLRARNDELLGRAAAAASSSRGGGGGMVVKVRAESERHTAAVDVFEVVLRRLKAMEELRVTAVRSCFGGAGMWMDVGVECKIPSCEMDKAITNALMELGENPTLQQDPGSSKPIFRCQVERGVLIP